MIRGSVNSAGRPVHGNAIIPVRSGCCTRCRRGTPALGSFECGNPDCRCHDSERLREHLTEQDRFWRAHTREDNTPDWGDLTPEEQLLVDEDRYLTENGGIAFYDETEND